MRNRSVPTVLLIGLVLTLGTSVASAQAFFSSIIERIDRLERRLNTIEAGQRREVRALRRQVADLLQQRPTTPALSKVDSSIVALRLRMDELALRLEQLQNRSANTQLAGARVSDRDSSIVAPLSQADQFMEYSRDGGSPTGADQSGGRLKGDSEMLERLSDGGRAADPLVTELRALIQELRVAIEELSASGQATANAAPEKAKQQDTEIRKLTFNGQVRPRSEFRDPAPSGQAMFTSMRARAQVFATLGRDVSVFLQFQDVRLWGEETSTLTDFRADNFDLHQGYAQLQKIGGLPISLRLGRQAISLGGQRLIGATEWMQQGRVFDGVRTTAVFSGGRVDLLAIKLAEANASAAASNAYLTGVYAQVNSVSNVALELYALYNRVSGGAGTDQVTLGLRWASQRSNISYRLEGSYQTGERSGLTVSAYMFGARVGTSVARGKGEINVWYDYLSGDDDPTDAKVKVFDTLFAANHMFYGFADLFLNIPVHTNGRGLRDLAIKTSVFPRKAVKIGLDFHFFGLAEKGGLASGQLAEEADLTLSYRYSPNVAFVWGFSYVTVRDGFAAIGRGKENVSLAYLMTNVTF